MAESEYSTTTELPVETVWAFVSEMDHWAPMLTGYQGHEKQSETDSLWTLKGDVGALADAGHRDAAKAELVAELDRRLEDALPHLELASRAPGGGAGFRHRALDYRKRTPECKDILISI